MKSDPIAGVSFTAVELGPGILRTRAKTTLHVTLPHALDRCEREGRVHNFERAAFALQGRVLQDKSPPGYPFDDTDVYKVLEGAAYALAMEPNSELERRVDELITKIASAQEPDGYLYTTRTIDPESPHPWAGQRRWELETHLSHELYNLGHLFEAATTHYHATRKRTLLEVAVRAADLLCNTFGPGKVVIWPGHPITEMALAGLFRAVGDPRYLELAKFLLDARGPDGHPRSGETYNQSHAPIVLQTEAVGHAVRAMYLYSGMADVASLSASDNYLATLRQLWSDIVTHKLYLTGGIGARHSDEAFGERDELPNLTGYNETCAAIGLVYFSYRMFLLTGHAEYVDVLERVLYNGLLSGISLDGRSFFYPNPLESFGEYERSPWFGCACCPGNLTRFLASVSTYLFARGDSTIYVNLYAASTARIELSASLSVSLCVKTDYPWHGAVRIVVQPTSVAQWTLKLRMPGWARGEVVPSDLYSFVDGSGSGPTVTINGELQELASSEGYAGLQRIWHPGDIVELDLPMPVRRVAAALRVTTNRGRIALQRGPIVYALEGTDHENGQVLDVFIEPEVSLRDEFTPDLLDGVVVIRGKGKRIARGDTRREHVQSVSLTAIPYHTWANRGASEMLVWIPDGVESAWVRPPATIASTSQVAISAGQCPRAANDQIQPRSSRDESHKRTRIEPGRDGLTWIQYDFALATRTSKVSLYWFESADWRTEAAPRSWRLLYLDTGKWRECRNLDPYTTLLDCFNEVRFDAFDSVALRLVCEPRAGCVIGLLEWHVG